MLPTPTFDAYGGLTLSSGTAHAKGKGGGGNDGPGRGHDGSGRGHGGPGRGHDGHADRGVDHGHGVGRGHVSHGNGLGLGHEKARGYGHHHDANYDGNYSGSYHDHDRDGSGYSGQHRSDPSFSAAMGNARRDFGRVKSKAKQVWSGFWN
jgi:hypothetical protein